MTPEQIASEVDRLEQLVTDQRETARQAYDDRLRSALRRRRQQLEAGRLQMNCACRCCLAALATEDPERLCPTGLQTLVQVVGL